MTNFSATTTFITVFEGGKSEIAYLVDIVAAPCRDRDARSAPGFGDVANGRGRLAEIDL